VNSVVVNQNTLHLKVGLFASFLIVKLNKCVLQTITSPLVSDDLTREDLAKAAEDQIQVFV